MLRIHRYAGWRPSEEEIIKLPKLVLAFDLRQKSRLRVKLSDGTDAALFLLRGTILCDGDILEAEDGRLVRVESSPQEVLVVTAEGTDDLIKAAYHLGNRHTPVEIGTDYLKLESDPVLKEMLLRLGVDLKGDCSVSTRARRLRRPTPACS
jgi:urease accessory protein